MIETSPVCMICRLPIRGTTADGRGCHHFNAAFMEVFGTQAPVPDHGGYDANGAPLPDSP